MAGRFRFRLEAVRRVRKQTQDTQRRVVAGAVQAVQEVENRMGRLTEELDLTMDRSRDARRPRDLDISALRSHQVYRGCIHRRLLESATEIVKRRATLDVERSKLAETTKRLKAIEKLRERKLASHVKAIARAEQAGQDETATGMYLRALGAVRAGGMTS